MGDSVEKEYLEKAISFAEYEQLIEQAVAEGKTTGPNQSEALANYTRLNQQRMQRLEKTVELIEPVVAAARELSRPQTWLIITEGWCGDAAQNIPVIEKIAAENKKIKTRYILRDENPELIDRFLTNGTKAIPKLIALDEETLEVLGVWGARPRAAQELFIARREAGVEKPAIIEEIQRWYNEDRGVSLQTEFIDLLRTWGLKASAAA